MKNITIKGAPFPCRVTMGAMLRFKRETGKEVSEIERGDVVGLLTFLWCCTASACSADGVPFDMPLEAFADSCDMEVFSQWSRALMEDAVPEKKTTRKGV